MPLTFTYDAERNLVLGVASGRVTGDDFGAGEMPDYPVGTPELFDVRAVTEVEVTGADIRRVAERERLGPARISRMAIVTGSVVAYGLSRMFQMLADEAEYEIEVFRELDDALKWLDRETPKG